MSDTSPSTPGVHEFPAGTVLFREGDHSREAYVVRSGAVTISRSVDGRERFVASMGPGELFGEMALLNGDARSGTATVAEGAQILVLAPETFEQMIAASPEIAQSIISKLAQRVAATNAQIASLMVRDHSARFANLLGALADKQGTELPDGRRHVQIGLDELVGAAGMDIRATLRDVLDQLSMAGVISIVEGGFYVAPKDGITAYLDAASSFGES